MRAAKLDGFHACVMTVRISTNMADNAIIAEVVRRRRAAIIAFLLLCEKRRRHKRLNRHPRLWSRSWLLRRDQQRTVLNMLFDELRMEVMEEGNLLDRVSILLQRDSAYYEENQSVLQEGVCAGVAGGALDFPHHASFAAVKMVTWWEQQHIAVFGLPSGLIYGMEGVGSEMGNPGGPEELVATVDSCCRQLMAHLHYLSQEALDHADLQVLTSTLGAAALVSNALWMYNQNKQRIPGKSLAHWLKEYQGMREALAERVLDLHCRLVCLYVLQDRDCLHWEDQQPFFESERGSFIVQMWWLYLQGTRQDLWSSLPPKTAQRVFGGILNESLTIFTARYSQAKTSPARLPLIVNDICNILKCVAHLLPAVCSCAKELTGEKCCNLTVSHLHDKCHHLLTTLLFRAASLATLHKIFCRGLEEVECFKPVPEGSFKPWFAFVNDDIDYGTRSVFQLPARVAIYLELNILKAQPHTSWGLLLKILMMRKCWVASKLLRFLAVNPRYIGSDDCETKCSGFMCNSDCYLGRSNVEQATTYIVVFVGSEEDVGGTLIHMLERRDISWADPLDRNQIWNQKRPGWLEALIAPLGDYLDPIIVIIEKATKEGGTTSQLTGLSVALLAQSVDCLPACLLQASRLIHRILPVSVSPMGNHLLVQFIYTALYTRLIDTPLAEAFCYMEDDQLEPLLEEIKNLEEIPPPSYDLEASEQICELQVSRLLLTKAGRTSLKVLFEFMTKDSWIMEVLEREVPHPNTDTLLFTMFHIGQRPFDQVLTGDWQPDWDSLLSTPLGLQPHAAWCQIQARLPRSTDLPVSNHDRAAAAVLTRVFSPSSEDEGSQQLHSTGDTL